MSTHGICSWAPGEPLLELIIVDGESRTSLIQPSVEEIQHACRQYGLPGIKVVETIRGMDRKYHTFLIDVPKYLQHLEEEKTFTLVIEKEQANGYGAGPVYSFDCPMCDRKMPQDLSLQYVERLALDHLGDGHRVRRQKIRVEIKEKS